MKVAAPTLLPLMRSRLQGDVLAWVFLHPDQAYSIADIATHVGASQVSVLREVNRLVAADLVTDVRQGRSRMISPNPANPATAPLSELLAVTFGPVPVLREALAGVPGVDRALIYGSWADRYHGNAGRSPGDIDVLVVGDTDEDLLDEVARAAERRLGREVSIRRVRPERWADAGSGFVQTVRGRPVVDLVGGDG